MAKWEIEVIFEPTGDTMNKDEWDKSYTERNAKAEMWGGALAWIFILVPVFAVLALLNPKILI